MNKECHHENIKKICFIDYAPNGSVHGPRTEIWRVKCLDCGKVYKERFIGDKEANTWLDRAKRAPWKV